MTKAAGNPPPAPASPPGTARWLNMVTTVVVGAVVLIVIAAAAPSILHAGIRASDDPATFPPPVRAQSRPFAPHDHPGARGLPIGRDDDDDQDIDEPPGARPRSPNDPRQKPPGFPPPGSDDDEPLGLKGGVTLRPLPIRDRRTNAVISEVRAGEKVHILRDDGEWLLVLQSAESGTVTGWAKRSELLLR